MEETIRTYFLQATEQVLLEMGFSGLTFDHAKETKEQTSILVSLGLVGDLKGYFIVNIGAASATTFARMVSSFLSMEGEDPADVRYQKSLLGEISNQIGGRATVLLAEHGFDCDITPPTVLSGENLKSAIPGSTNDVRFNVMHEFGSFSVIVALKSVGKS